MSRQDPLVDMLLSVSHAVELYRRVRHGLAKYHRAVVADGDADTPAVEFVEMVESVVGKHDLFWLEDTDGRLATGDAREDDAVVLEPDEAQGPQVRSGEAEA